MIFMLGYSLLGQDLPGLSVLKKFDGDVFRKTFQNRCSLDSELNKLLWFAALLLANLIGLFLD